MSKRNSDVQPRTEKIIKLLPPDGGWGWMVLLGTGLSNVSNDLQILLLVIA